MKAVQWILMSICVVSAGAVSGRTSAVNSSVAGNSVDPGLELSAQEVQENSDRSIAAAIADRRKLLRAGNDDDISAMIQARRSAIRSAKPARATTAKEETK